MVDAGARLTMSDLTRPSRQLPSKELGRALPATVLFTPIVGDMRHVRHEIVGLAQLEPDEERALACPYGRWTVRVTLWDTVEDRKALAQHGASRAWIVFLMPQATRRLLKLEAKSPRGESVSFRLFLGSTHIATVQYPGGLRAPLMKGKD